MKPAADKLKEKLLSANFSAPKFRVFNNVDARTESDPEKIRDALVRQLCNPVRWTETVIEIKKLFSGEEGTFLEFGPGKVLTGLLRRIDRSLKGTAVNTDETVKEVTE
jgi:[acyl-carrier-protein] S-malonyltransferase